jgi:hypothetical protein
MSFSAKLSTFDAIQNKANRDLGFLCNAFVSVENPGTEVNDWISEYNALEIEANSILADAKRFIESTNLGTISPIWIKETSDAIEKNKTRMRALYPKIEDALKEEKELEKRPLFKIGK